MSEQGVLETIGRYRLVSDAERHSAEFDAQKGKGGGSALQVLIENELISASQVKRLEKRHGKLRPACFKCLKLSSFDRGDFLGTFQCRHCKEQVSFQKGTAGHVEELLPNPPERAVDKIVEKLLVKGGLKAEQVTKLKQKVRESVPRLSIPDLMLRDNLMPRGQVFKLRGKAEAIIRSKIPHWRDLGEDYELGRFLCMTLLVSHRVLSDTLQNQFEAVIKGTYTPLRDALAAKQELTGYQLRRFIPDVFDDRQERQALLDAIEAERQLPDQAESAAQIEVDWDDSMNELVLESRELRLNLLDD